MNPGKDLCVFECSAVEVKLYCVSDYGVATVSTERVGMPPQFKWSSNLVVNELMWRLPLFNLALPADWEVMKA